jgi:hypothetical protein
MDHPNAGAFVDCPVVHHFDECGWRGFFVTDPCAAEMQHKPSDICAGQSPVNPMWLATEGGGAEGTPGYLAHAARDQADRFYNESTPTWWIPGRYYDLRDTWCTFYLKEIAPITVAPGYTPHLFACAYMPNGIPGPDARLCCWHIAEPLMIGQGEWAYNEIHVANDPSEWVNYYLADDADTLDGTLAHCGFIGWMYYSSDKRDYPYRPVQGTGVMGWKSVRATGILGWDEMRYNLKAADFEDLRAGRPLKNALVL